MISPSADDKRLADEKEETRIREIFAAAHETAPVSILLRLLDAAQARLAEAEQEVNRRKGDPVTRLHNLVEGLSEDLGTSPFSKEEWDEIEAHNKDLRARLKAAEERVSALVAIIERVRAALDDIDSKYADTGWRMFLRHGAADASRAVSEALSPAASQSPPAKEQE